MSHENGKPSKRLKSSQACLACRKQKTRCEMINSEEKTLGRCHRCLILNLQCSLQPSPSPSRGNHPSSSPGDPSATTFIDPLHFLSQANLSSKENVGISSLGPPLGENGLPKRVGYSTKMWGFMSPDAPNMDWSAPVNSLHHVLDRLLPARSPSVPPTPQSSLAHIIEPAQIENLLNIFEKYYDPWLCFKSTRHQQTPLLDLARCAVASRHLEPSLRNAVAPWIHQLAEKSISSLVLDPSRPTMEHIQALLIFSQWAPLHESAHRGIKDGRQLLSIATSMAINLRFNQFSTHILDHQKRHGNSTPVSESILEKAMVWLSLCNAESMMSIGTGSIPITRRSEADRILFQSSDVGTLEDGRKTRLRILASLYDLSERGTCINFTDMNDVEQWYNNVNNILRDMSTLYDSVTPMIAITDHDHFAFHILKVHYNSCRMLVLYHNVFILRYALRHLPPGPVWTAKVRPQGLAVVPLFAQSLHKCAESVMELAILSDSELLATIPDALFLQITSCAAVLVGAKFLLKQNREILLRGLSDQLLTKGAEKLANCTTIPDHPAQKSAKLIGTMLSVWDRYLSSILESPTPPSPTSEYTGPTVLQPDDSVVPPSAMFSPSSQDSPHLNTNNSMIHEPSIFVSGENTPAQLDDPPSLPQQPQQHTPPLFENFFGENSNSQNEEFWHSYFAPDGGMAQAFNGVLTDPVAAGQQNFENTATTDFQYYPHHEG